MKIKNLKSKKSSLFEVTLKKFQIYKNTSINNLELKFKQILYIISNYHLNQKKILFIGLPYSNNQLLLKYSKHNFVTKKLIFDYLKDTNKLKNISLIVFFNSKVEDVNILKKLHFVNKPLIIIGQEVFIKNKVIGDYVIHFNTMFKPLKQFCTFLIYSIIKK